MDFSGAFFLLDMLPKTGFFQYFYAAVMSETTIITCNQSIVKVDQVGFTQN